MSLSRGEINPLGVLGLRKLKFIPSHFARVSVDPFIDVRLLEHWISFNLNSRYALKKRYALDEQNKMKEVLEIGLEDPKEITLLTLGCPHLYRKKDFT